MPIRDVLIRDAVAADLAAIGELFNALIATETYTYREHLADAAEMTAWFAAQHEAANPVLVAELDGVVVGYTTWSLFRYSARLPGYRHSAELTVHVAAGHHGHGIGRALIDALLAEARRRDIHVLIAGIDSSNVASIEFHRRLGFVETARMPEVGTKFGRWLTLVFMQRTVPH
ncbi:MAG TPA: GNAT family N-acetyltransferase [Ilumatobacter sp.]|nr:GNAT family N-acetyltransferase [Ilumatobacter sp.]